MVWSVNLIGLRNAPGTSEAHLWVGLRGCSQRIREAEEALNVKLSVEGTIPRAGVP